MFKKIVEHLLDLFQKNHDGTDSDWPSKKTKVQMMENLQQYIGDYKIRLSQMFTAKALVQVSKKIENQILRVELLQKEGDQDQKAFANSISIDGLLHLQFMI